MIKGKTKHYSKEKPAPTHLRWFIIGMFIVGGLVLAGWGIYQVHLGRKAFDGQKAYAHVLAQTSFGARIPGSEAHARTVEYIHEVLQDNDWQVALQHIQISGKTLINIQAEFGEGERIVLLGAHYDSRIYADRDANPQNRLSPVPGANDGASGVAVLLEMARVIPFYYSRSPGNALADKIWLVFFDGEDNGHIPGWDWILGSRGYVSQMSVAPTWVVIVDMIGDAHLNIYKERNSDPSLTQDIWQVASLLGYEQYFIPYEKYRILDDHIPFIEAGIPAVDIIDFDYAYFHTVADTADKVSARSLKIVGDVLLKWLFPDYNQ